VRAHSERHRVEEVLEQGKGEVGLGQYEVRSWVGWHPHMTLALLALWFLTLERRRLGGKNPGLERGATAGGVQPAAPATAAAARADRCGGQSRTAA
jgi:SRSO17 transposase